MSKHSPGPWRAEGDDIVDVNGVVVCRPDDASDDSLIAAAPEMLELLRKLEGWRDGECESCGPNAATCVECEWCAGHGHRPDCALGALIARIDGD